MKLQFLPFLLLAACASGHCRTSGKTTDAEVAATSHSTAATPATTSAPSAPVSPSAPTPATSAASAAKVLVFKADGSKQCSQTKGTDLKAMEAQLTKAGVKVLSSSKQPDGMMHTQVCGAATGTANTYEINSSDLKKAEKLGFRRLEN